jgi:hypothetical protein
MNSYRVTIIHRNARLLRVISWGDERDKGYQMRYIRFGFGPSSIGYGARIRACGNVYRLIRCQCDRASRLSGLRPRNGTRNLYNCGRELSIWRLGHLYHPHPVQCQPQCGTPGQRHQEDDRSRLGFAG